MSGHPKPYEPREIEPRWQQRWQEDALYEAKIDTTRPKLYCLTMLPYPSGELHMGHWYAMTPSDARARFKRMQGFNVLFPIGFDAFGLPAENAAIKRNVHPREWTYHNIDNMRRQLRTMGAMWDWHRETVSSDPAYYRWTQWFFLQLFKNGLAYRKLSAVDFCPTCNTTLAREQVWGDDRHCERCSTPVIKKKLDQWFFKITDYADELLSFEGIDWPDRVKLLQTNWIGRSEGAHVTFRTEAGDDLEVFTTRPDTLWGATFMVLAPEHPLVSKLTTEDRRSEVNAYVEAAVRQTDIEREAANREKTGVFTGSYAVNPVNDERIPLWVADYVLMGYGTGAIMAVPGHDQRDFEFASTYGLDIRRVVAAPGEDADTPLDEAYQGDGFLVNSERFDDIPVAEAKPAIVDWLAERDLAEAKVNFRIHDWCISRQRYWGPPIPIVYCEDCGTVPVPEDDLPVILPRVEDFKPDDSGVSPLARVEEWYRTECPECGAVARRETDVSDTFLDSSWYFLRYPSTDFDDKPIDEDITRTWLPVDCYIGGNEHAVLHLLYARFITMALHDMGHVQFEEPFVRFRAHGLIIRDGAKMSKSKGNVVVPDEIIERYGADTLRIYLMFLGPFEEGGDYRDEGIQGPHGFLHRLWDTVINAQDGDPDPDVERKLHQTIAQVTAQIPTLQYNTAIAALMEYLNSVRAGGRTAIRAEVEPLVVLTAPFAPHIAEELWCRLGNEGTIFGHNWPEHDPEKAKESSVEVAVQVNGKLRATVRGPAGMSQEMAEELARKEENVARYLDEGTVKRTIYVPSRLLNFVVGSADA